MENKIPETPTPIPTPPISLKETFFTRLKKNLVKQRTLVLILFLALGFAAVVLGFRVKYLQSQTQASYLAVVSTSPLGTSQSAKPKIRVNFNLPVTAHNIPNYFSISPFVDGTLIQGSNPNEVIFEPKSSFSPGTPVYVTLKTGLPSDAGKKLLSDYSFNFSIAYDANTISFTSNGWSGKFMSFEASRGTNIILKVGNGVEKPGIKIYRASPEILIENLVYEKEKMKYFEKPPDTSKLKFIKEFKDVKDSQEINFKDEVGIYYFEGLENDNLTNSAWIALNESGIHLRQDDQKVYLAAQSLSTGQPDGGIEIIFYELDEKPKVIAKHTLSGIQEYPLEFPQRLDLVLAKKGKDTMIIPVSIPNSQAEIRLYSNLDKKHNIFLYTDRPIYKKGAQVSFRGVVRKDNDGLYQLPDVDKVKVFQDTDNSGQKIEQIIDINEGGIFSGEFTLAQDIKEGQKYLYATTDLEGKDYNSEGYIYFDIFEYKKPSFGLDIGVEKEEYTKGDTAKVTLSGKYFNGSAFANQKVSYSVYGRDYYETEKVAYNSSFKLNGWGGMCGGGGFDEYYGQPIGTSKEVVLDNNGLITLEFPTSQLDSLLSQELTFVVEKTDENNNKIVAAKNTIVHQGEFNIFYRPGPNRIAFGDEFSMVFYAENNVGEKLSNSEFTYEIYEESWSAGQSKSEKKIVKTGIVKTDQTGTGVFKDRLEGTDQTRYYYISVIAEDSRNNKIEGRKGVIFFNKSEKLAYKGWPSSSLDQTVLKITSLKNSLSVGEDANLEIISPTDMAVFMTLERGRVYTPQWLTLKKGTNNISFGVTNTLAPSISPTFSFFYNGEYFIEGLSLNVPALHKLLTVEISKDKEVYSPGDTAIITITTKDNSGNLVSADVGAAIVDKAIFALRKNAAPPFHSSLYYYRGRSINTSSSLSWIAMFDWGGGGGGGGGLSQYLKDVDTLYWNPGLKTGTDGQVKIEVPVYETVTTWKILAYASTDDTKIGQADSDFLVTK